MTSPSSNRFHITDEILLEMLFRADKLINDKTTMSFSIGDVWISSSARSLDVFYKSSICYAFTYWKPEDGFEEVSLDNIRARCNWGSTDFRAALKILREAMVLDDLAKIHD